MWANATNSLDMKTLLRSSSLTIAALLGLTALAQQPYSVTIAGTVVGCTANSSVSIVSLPGVQPAVDIDVPVLPPSCTFTVTLELASQGGGFTVSVPCLGAIQSQVVQYQVPALGDSTAVSVTFNCGNTMTDCLGVPGGNAMPGTACTTFLGVPGTWSADCICVANNSNLDCEGVPNGPAQPGTPCNTPNGATGLWTANCICDTDTMGGAYDCLGQLNGPNLPGTPCWVLGTNFIGLWDANCACVDSTTTGGGCSASFWAMQAMEFDSLNNPNGGGSPIPYEVWVWNLSTGNGAMTYNWDFGDGSTSNLAYPTHTYSGNGPYNLCLTISDGAGCTDMFCDSISMDGDGILVGMALENGADGSAARQDGFTINVQNPLVMGVSDAAMLSQAAIWPNPSSGELNLAAVSLADGLIDISIHDVSGRLVLRESRAMATGRNQHSLDARALPAGVYTLRAADRTGKAISLRFVKAD
ncbi:MAG: T9SS type A sorting domain-containing protein [Flavobacteriales bacterium]|nr:T9SS type A sorting domain-containing protein [Flavobacteriales bacterium]